LTTLLRGSGLRRAAAAVLATGLLVGTPALPGGAAPHQEPPPTTVPFDPESGTTDLKTEYDEVIGREAALVGKVLEAAAERKKATDELDKLRYATQAKELELGATQAELAEATRVAARYTAARKVAERKVAEAQERLRRQIVASYVTGGETGGIVEAMLKAKNGEEAGQAIAYSKAIVGDTDQLVEALAKARTERRKADKRARTARNRARKRRDEIAAATIFLTKARDQASTLVDLVSLKVAAEANALRAVQGRKALVEGRINAMNRSSDGVAMILADLQKDQPDWLPGSVLITTPIPGHFPGSKFGMRHHPILGIDRLHAGCDIGAGSGEPIYAPADGFVVLAGERGGYGNTTVIDHGNSLGTLYGHQSRIVVLPGQTVKRGDLIGYVGSTGLSTGPHLHFETRIKGLPIDPEGVVDFRAPVDYPR
jgi:murein DD-endopeptidase MepM/ murein hydrolase activator NlpD